MATFYKAYFNKALLNFQFNSSLIYDIVSLGKKGILTCREAAYFNHGIHSDPKSPAAFGPVDARVICKRKNKQNCIYTANI